MSDEMQNETATKPKIKLSMNLDTMKLRELALFEKVTGRPVSDLIKFVPVLDEDGHKVPDPDPAAKGKPLMQAEMTSYTMMAMILIARQREEGRDAVTLEDVEEMTLDDVEMNVEKKLDDSVDPTLASPDAVSESSTDLPSNDSASTPTS